MSGNPYTSRSHDAPAPRSHGVPSSPARGGGPQGLADVLERVLDKGLVIAGDIQLNLVDIEIITIKIRLLLASADTAQQMGIDWWKRDPFLSSEARELQDETRELEEENQLLHRRLERVEALLEAQLPEGAGDDTEGVHPAATLKDVVEDALEGGSSDTDADLQRMSSRPAREWEERGDEF